MTYPTFVTVTEASPRILEEYIVCNWNREYNDQVKCPKDLSKYAKLVIAFLNVALTGKTKSLWIVALGIEAAEVPSIVNITVLLSERKGK